MDANIMAVYNGTVRMKKNQKQTNKQKQPRIVAKQVTIHYDNMILKTTLKSPTTFKSFTKDKSH